MAGDLGGIDGRHGDVRRGLPQNDDSERIIGEGCAVDNGRPWER